MLIRKVEHNIYDIFMGTGWPREDAVPYASDATWTRVRRYHWGLKQIAGTYLPRKVLREVMDKVMAP